MMPTSQQFAIHYECSPVIQMLAFSLEVRAYLSNNVRVSVIIPEAVFSKIPNEIFEELVFDNLSQLTPHLDKMLDIKVKPINHFQIDARSTGD
jgi:hypothetical protein